MIGIPAAAPTISVNQGESPPKDEGSAAWTLTAQLRLGNVGESSPGIGMRSTRASAACDSTSQTSYRRLGWGGLTDGTKLMAMVSTTASATA